MLYIALCRPCRRSGSCVCSTRHTLFNHRPCKVQNFFGCKSLKSLQFCAFAWERGVTRIYIGFSLALQLGMCMLLLLRKRMQEQALALLRDACSKALSTAAAAPRLHQSSSMTMAFDALLPNAEAGRLDPIDGASTKRRVSGSHRRRSMPLI